MMPTQLNMKLLFGHAATHHGDQQIVTHYSDGTEHRYTYREHAERVGDLMHLLRLMGVLRGQRIATLAWNHHQHLECYMAIPLYGAILHPINMRLSLQEIAFIIQDADDAVIFADEDQRDVITALSEMGVLHARTVIFFGGDYEKLIDTKGSMVAPDLDEYTPMGLCYTSGTTGRPKAAVYTHRSVYLHALTTTSRASCDIGPSDCVLPGPPMFHTMGWGLLHASILAGAKIVLWAGPLDPDAMVALMGREHVTISAGVPTVWQTLYPAFREHRLARYLRHVIVGGARPARTLIDAYFALGIPMLQLWGMTEVSLCSMSWCRDGEDEADVTDTAGYPLPGIDISIRDEYSSEVPTGRMGDLWVRGPWVAASYWKGRQPELFHGGWFKTGDVALRLANGRFVIADRTKDLIKSGGEWISSVDMENTISGMHGITEAAVIAMPDEKWQERPMAVAVAQLDPTTRQSLEAVRAYLTENGWAKWQLPDRIEYVTVLPRTSVGKIDKKALRVRFGFVMESDHPRPAEAAV